MALTTAFFLFPLVQASIFTDVYNFLFGSQYSGIREGVNQYSVPITTPDIITAIDNRDGSFDISSLTGKRCNIKLEANISGTYIKDITKLTNYNLELINKDNQITFQFGFKPNDLTATIMNSNNFQVIVNTNCDKEYKIDFNDITIPTSKTGKLQSWNYMQEEKKTIITLATGSLSLKDDVWIDPVITINDVSIQGILNNVQAEDNFTHLKMNESLVLYMPFDIDRSSVFTAYDYSPYNNDGSYRSTNSWQFPTYTSNGRIGGGYFFNGVNQSIYLGASNPYLINLNKSGTISLWFNSTSAVSSSQTLFAQGAPESSKNSYGMYISSSKLYCRVANTTVSSGTAGYTIAFNVWNHAVCTWNTTTVSVYLNGDLVQTGAASPDGYIYASPYIYAQIGGYSYLAYRTTNGTIDEVMVYNSTLSSTDVSNLYNNQSSRFYNSGTAMYNVSMPAGYNQVNVSTPIQTNFNNTNISLKIDYYDTSWHSTAWQNVPNMKNLTYTISSTATRLNLTYNFTSDANSFYSPVVLSSINLETWSVPKLNISIIVPIAEDLWRTNATQYDFFNVTIQVCCEGSNCGQVNVSLDPKTSCTPTTETCTDAGCQPIFLDSTTDWAFSTPYCVGQNFNWYRIYPDASCDTYLSNVYNDDCAFFDDLDGQLWCPSAKRVGHSVTTADCHCEPIIDTCGIPKWVAFNFSDEFFTEAKRGLINDTIGAIPFYTNQTNPRNISLNAGECKSVVFWVNATGMINNNYTFYAYANVTNSMFISNMTGTWNVTIVSGTAPPPPDTILPYGYKIAPPNNTASSAYNNSISIRFEFSAIDETALKNATAFFWNTTALVGFNYTVMSGTYNTTNLTYLFPKAGRYYWNVLIYDTSNNFNWTSNGNWSFNVSDVIAPYFLESPANITITYGTQLRTQLNASDETELSCFSVNDTRFSVNCSGYFINATSLQAGLYTLNLTINDTSNNLNSTYFWVNVTQALGNITAWINNSRSNFTSSLGNNTWINGTLVLGQGNIKLYLNTSLINGGASPLSNLTNLSFGTYWFNASYEGNINYTASIEDWFINITYQPPLDTTPPTFTVVPANLTLVYGQNFEVQYTATDETEFGTYYLGNWTNDFVIDATGKLSNKTSLPGLTYYIINITINDSSGNTATAWYNLTINRENGLIRSYVNHTEAEFKSYNTTLLGVNNIWLNATLITGQGTINMSLDGEFIQGGNSPLANLTNLTIGYYNLTGWYFGNENYSVDSEYWWINITSTGAGTPDTTPPVFTNCRNLTGNNNTAFSQSITATDNVAIDSYMLNDTSNFTIGKATGLIVNVSFLNWVGIYDLNLTVNDTSNNEKSCLFWINISEYFTGISSINIHIFPSFTNNVPYIQLQRRLKFI